MVAAAAVLGMVGCVWAVNTKGSAGEGSFGGHSLTASLGAVGPAGSAVAAAPSWSRVSFRRAPSPAGLQHYARDCWHHCGKKAGLCDWCGPQRSCCKYQEASDPESCGGVNFWPALTYHTCVAPSLLGIDKDNETAALEVEEVRREVPLPQAPVFEYYVYRSMSFKEYPFGNVNVGNLPGVMWYLTNEVMPRCPKRYNITQIKRIKVNTRASPELYAKGMNFGVRYSYDHGKCTGSNTRNLGPCELTWERFGHVVGCNNFRDRYPWPVVNTAYPDGIWYDFPLEGKCDSPTGEWNCTWSFEDAGSVLLEEEIEAQHKGAGYYCHGRHTKFWNHALRQSSGSWRVQQVLDAFGAKYPEQPRDLPAPPCDFQKRTFWSTA